MACFRRSIVLGLVVVFMATTRAGAEGGLAARIDAVINGPDYRHAHWGLLVVDSQTGETVYAHNADKLFRPASTTKLYSCSAALLALGPDFKIETPVYRRGTLTDGRLRGDLILVAKGDLTLGGRTTADGRMTFKDHDHTYANGNDDGELTDTDPLTGLKELAHQVVRAGLRRIDGDVLVDDRLFERARGSGSGPDLLTPILVNDNVIDVVIQPGKTVGAAARAQLRPETSYVTLDAQVETAAAGTKARTVLTTADGRSLTVRGRVPLRDKPIIRIFPVADPAAFARALFLEALRREGVQVAASPIQPARGDLPDKDGYARLDVVARYTSPPLSEAVKVTLKVSHNLYASTLPLLLAAQDGKRTLADGMRLEQKALAGLGLDGEAVSFGGGAGGANSDHVTPRATVQLFQALAKRPEYPHLLDGLPVLGVDGTLVDVVGKDSAALGKVRAKTGTLFWNDLYNGRDLLTSKALAGTMTTAKGRTLTFALFVNNVPLPKGVAPSREGKTLGRLCEIFYQDTP